MLVSLKAQLVRHKVSVLKSANTAEIDLAWDAGERHRLGPIRFSESQFPDAFLQRYKPRPVPCVLRVDSSPIR